MLKSLVRFKVSGPVLIFMAAAVALGLALGTSAPAGAQSTDWCAGDPILRVNGKTLNVIAAVQGSSADVRANVQHAHFKIFLPAGVAAEIVGYDGDFFTESAEIIFDDALTYSPGQMIEMRVEVTFRATKAFPALVYVIADSESRQVAAGISTNVLAGTYLMNP